MSRLTALRKPAGGVQGFATRDAASFHKRKRGQHMDLVMIICVHARTYKNKQKSGARPGPVASASAIMSSDVASQWRQFDAPPHVLHSGGHEKPTAAAWRRAGDATVG